MARSFRFSPSPFPFVSPPVSPYVPLGVSLIGRACQLFLLLSFLRYRRALGAFLHILFPIRVADPVKAASNCNMSATLAGLTR